MTEAAGKPPVDKKPANDADALDALKSLLLGEEQQQLEEISERVADPGLRSSDIAEVLPESLRLSDSQGSELTNALERPVTRCIQRRIERDPDSFADALYPVMGPAIRQSIAATFKDLVANINRTLEHSLSAQGIKWRLEAVRSGVPFPEVVLRHTLSYRVEQVFLIQNDSGLLMQHVQDDLAVSADADAVSGMLTAIAQFVRDAFQAGDKEGLETVEIGDHTVLLVHGPSAYLACVIRGIPPGHLREHCQEVMEQLYRRHARALAGFDGDPGTLVSTRALLESCLLSEHKDTGRKKGLAPATLLLLLLLIGAIVWGLFTWWSGAQEKRELRAKQEGFLSTLRDQPGLVIAETHFEPKLQVRGLRDPLAVSPASLLGQHDLPASQVDLQFRPYLDVSPRFALQRAKARLLPPDTVRLEMDEQGTLSVSGVASSRWIERASLLAAGVPGINAYDDSELLSHDQQLLEQAQRTLNPPDKVQLSVDQGVLHVEGQAPLAWTQGLPNSASKLARLLGLNIQVQTDEQLQFQALRQDVEGSGIQFIEDTVFDSAQEQQAAALAGRLQQLLFLADSLGYSVQAVIIGRTDGLGSPVYNEQLALARALIARDTLIMHGLPSNLFQLQTAVGQAGLADPRQRRAELRLLVSAPQPSGLQ